MAADSLDNYILALAFGRHVVQGKLIMHDAQTVGQDKQVTIFQALGVGPWHQAVRRYYAGGELTEAAGTVMHFHPGTLSTSEDPATDTQQGIDPLWPTGLTYSGTAYDAIRLPPGIADDNDPTKFKGIYDCLLVEDYDSSGQALGRSWTQNAARHAAYLIVEAAALGVSRIDWPSWVQWRDCCDEQIVWQKDSTTTATIARFLSNVFFATPTDLETALNLLCTITATDWQDSDGAIKFLPPTIARTPVYEFTPSKTKDASFTHWRKDRSERPARVTLYWRDIEDELIADGDPIIIERADLFDGNGQAQNELAVNVGAMTRSQAQRIANHLIRLKSDLEQYCSLTGGGDSFHIAPGDVVQVTRPELGWSQKLFQVIEASDEPSDSTADERTFTLLEYDPSVYSDSDEAQLQPRIQTGAQASAFAPPPAITSLTLAETHATLADGRETTIITGAVQFAAFFNPQRGRIWWKKPDASDYTQTDLLLVPERATLQAVFELRHIEPGIHRFKVVTENSYGISTGFAAAVEYPLNIAGPQTAPAAPAGYTVAFFGSDTGQQDFIQHKWTQEQDVEYEIGADENFTTIIFRGRASEYKEPRPDRMRGGWTRWLRARRYSLASAAVSATTVPAVIAPPARVSIGRRVSSGIVLNVALPASVDQLAQISETQVQIAEDAGFLTNAVIETRPGARSDVEVIGIPGSTRWMRTRYKTIFGDASDWSASVEHTFAKLGDDNNALGNLWFEDDGVYDIGRNPATDIFDRRPRYVYAAKGFYAGYLDAFTSTHNNACFSAAHDEGWNQTPAIEPWLWPRISNYDLIGNPIWQNRTIIRPGEGGLHIQSRSGEYDNLILDDNGNLTVRGSITGTLASSVIDNGGQVIDVRAFGAKCDGVTDDSAAVNAAYAAAKLTRQPLYFPKGTTLCNLKLDTWGITVQGAGPQSSFIRSFDSAQPVVEVDASAVSIHTILIRDLGLVGSVSGGNNHGLYVQGANLVAGLTVKNVTISSCGGRGVYDLASFTTRYEDVFISQPSGSHNAIELAGGNTTTLHRCYVTDVAAGRAAYRIYGGRPTLIACNGINTGANADWGIFGRTVADDGVDSYCYATLVECNVEDFTNRGIWCKVGSSATFQATSILAPATGTVLPLLFDYVAPSVAGTWDAISTINTKGAGYANGYAIHSNGMPFTVTGESAPDLFWWSGNVFTLPKITTNYIGGSGNYVTRLTRAAVDALESSTLTGDLIGGTTYTGARAFIKAPVADKGGAIFDVRAYGAKIDGVTDDQAAFDAAFAAASAVGGGVVFIPGGTTRVTKLAIPANVVLRGAGKRATTIKQIVSNEEIVLVNQFHSGVEDLTVSGNLGVDAHEAADGWPGQHGILCTHAQYVSDVSIRRVHIEQTGGEGLKIEKCFSSVFEGVETTWTYGAAGISVDAVNMPSVRFADCYVHVIGRFDGVGYWVRGGNPVFENCNGIDGWGSGGPSAVIWMRIGQDSRIAGDGTDKYANPTLIGCNIESFTHTGLQHRLASTSRLYGCSFSTGGNGTQKAISYETGGAYSQNGYIAADCTFFQDGDGVTYASNRAIHSYGRPPVYVEPALPYASAYYDTQAGATKALPFILALTSTPNTQNLVLATGNKAEVKSGLWWDEGSSVLTSPGRFWGADCSSGAPTYGFAADYSTGMYRDTTSGALSFAWGGSEKLRVRDFLWTAISFIPFTDAAVDLGIYPTNRFRDLALARNALIGGTLGVTGAATFSSTIAAGDATLGNASPSADTAKDLGTSALRWRDLKLARTLMLGGTSAQHASIVMDAPATNSTYLQFLESGVSKWWFYRNGGDANFYIRDMANAKMHLAFLPGASEAAAATLLYSSLLFSTDKAVDIGKTAANRPRDVFIGRNLNVADTVTMGGGTVWIYPVASLPTGAGGNLILGGGFGSPVCARMFIGDGSSWRMHFSKRLSSTTTDLFTFDDRGYFIAQQNSVAYFSNTADPYANYERGALKWASNEFVIGTEKGGSGTSRDITFAPTGDLNIAANNGARLSIKRLEELTTIAAAASTNTTIQIPAGAIVIGVAGRVVTADTGAGVTSFSIGVSGATTRYASNIANTAGITWKGTQDSLRAYTSATPIVITPNVTPGGGVRGAARIVIEYLDITAPTS